MNYLPRVEIVNTHPSIANGGSRGDHFTVRRIERRETVRYLRSDCEGFHVKQEKPHG